MDRFYTFLSGITIMCGQIKGQTRLPMPPVDLSGTKSSGKNRCAHSETHGKKKWRDMGLEG
jgi:hypothetical protein